MAFGLKKFSVRARVTRRQDGSLGRVAIIPTRSLKKKDKDKEEPKGKKVRKKPVKRKTRAGRG